jgi:hypothetical protein
MRSHLVTATFLLSFFVLGMTLSLANTEAQDALKPMIGKWKAMLSYAEGGGRFTVGLAEDTEVKQLGANMIGFSLKPVTAAEPVFDVRLAYDVASKKYLLTVKNGATTTIDKLSLTSAAGGLSGEGTLKDAGGQIHKVQVTITAKATGEHEWSFVDPEAPPKNNIVFGFSFFRRV